MRTRASQRQRRRARAFFPAKPVFLARELATLRPKRCESPLWPLVRYQLPVAGAISNPAAWSLREAQSHAHFDSARGDERRMRSPPRFALLLILLTPSLGLPLVLRRYILALLQLTPPFLRMWRALALLRLLWLSAL